MNSIRRMFSLCLVVPMMFSLANAQLPAPAPGSAVPRLVNYSGKATDASGKSISGIAGATFAIYKDQYEGAPLWLETQNIQADAKGNYTVQLGETKPDGLPLDLFSSGEAHWLGVTINGGTEQPRVLLLSVPYALKAADAETIGGLPPSAFVLAKGSQTSPPKTSVASSSAASSNAAPPANPNVTGKGTLGFIPAWDSASDIVNSMIFQKSSQIGIGTTAPAATLDVNGKSNVRDTLTLFPKGTDSTLAVSGTSFKVDQTGKVTFISGQTFPGAGTVTSVGLSAPTTDFTVTGSPVTRSGTLNFAWTVPPSNLNTANAIVKRDASGSFMANSITATGQLFATAFTGNGNAISGSSASPVATVIYGGASSSTGSTWAVEGETFSSDPGTVGVIGRAHNGGVGVSSLAAPYNSYYADSNVQQARTAGGWVKAMALISPTGVAACFNSTLNGSAAITPPCNFTFDHVGVGDWILDFGFQVDDRFFSATATDVGSAGTISVCTDILGGFGCTNSVTPNQAEISNYFTNCCYLDTKFYLVVY